MKMIFSLVMFLSWSSLAPAFAGQSRIAGSHNDIDWEFIFNDEYQDITGSWGNTAYSLEWDPLGMILDGKTAGETEEIAFYPELRKVELVARCGWGSLEYGAVTPFRVKGRVCESPIDLSFESQDAALEWITQRYAREVITEFPEPAQEGVLAYVLKLLSGARLQGR